MYADVSSEELMCAFALRDNTKSFVALYQRHGAHLLNWCKKKTTVHTAQDITQDVWLKVACNRGSYDVTKGKFLPWLFTLARNALCDMGRASVRRPTTALVDVHVDNTATVEALEAGVDVRATLARLPQQHGEMLTLAYIAGHSGAEVTQRMGGSEAANRVRIHRAMAAYRASVV